MRKQHTLLVGATGLIGGFCLDLLLQDEVFDKVTVLTRRSLARQHPRLVEHLVDFEQLSGHGELLKVDTVFCCLGTTLKAAGSKAAFEKVDYDYVKQIAELAATNGVQQFLLVSALGANPKALAFYSRVKGRAEQVLCALPFRTVHILRPSILLGPRRERRLNEEFAAPIARLISPLLVGPLNRLRPVQAEKVAAIMVELAKRDEPGVHIHYPSAI